jgi:hypothetical protein
MSMFHPTMMMWWYSIRSSRMISPAAIQDDFARRRADNLDVDAAHYRNRAIQEERALGPGYYVDLLRGMAAERAAMAQRMRTGNGATRPG